MPKKNLHRVLFLELKHLNGIKLSPSEESDLIGIAQTCPKQGGKACFVASALISSIYHYHIIPENNCINDVLAIKAVRPANKLDIYPNPSLGWVNLNFTLKDGIFASRVEIRNTLNQICYQKNLAKSSYGLLELDLEEIKCGVYTISLIDENGKNIKSEKLIKL